MIKCQKTSIIKQSENKGATLMVAIIIIGILMVFAFSLLLVTYTLYASQNKNIASNMNSEAANSLSIALKKELGADAESTSDLWKYLRFNIGRDDIWPYYCPELGRGFKQGDDETAKDAYKYFELKTNYRSEFFPRPKNDDDDDDDDDDDGESVEEDKVDYSKVNPDGFPGSIKLGVYWRLSDTQEKTAIENHEAPESDDIDIAHIRLYIDVICETASQTYVVTNEYELTIEEYTTREDTKLQEMLSIYESDDRYNPEHRVVLSTDEKNQKWVWKSK